MNYTWYVLYHTMHGYIPWYISVFCIRALSRGVLILLKQYCVLVMLSTSSLRRRPSSPSLKSYSNSCSALSKESLHASKNKKRKPSNYGISKETVSTEWMIMLNGEDVTPLPLVPNSESMRKNKLITYDEILKKFPSKANSLPWLFDSNVKG